MRKNLVENVNAPKRITKIQFGTLTSDEIQKSAELHVTSRELYKMPQRTPSSYGCLDTRLGISDKISTCQTCK
jgi:DNA-directed RNA polymerase III subunit RPC1